MSINHFSSELFPQTYCTTTTKQQQQQYYSIMDNETTRKSSISPNNKNHEIPKEHMFEKPLTPSDVGKLNRLVIPKQHAEKYFPLNNNNNNNDDNNDSGEKGLLLSFEDELGKIWKFRYSYWNSSQSYVLTKGWSRFVKEKKLESGDVVLFMRHVLDGDRQFIGWRRRSAAVATTVAEVTKPGGVGDGGGWASYGGTGNTYPYAGVPYPATGRGDQMQNQTGANGSNTRRQVRLFGVNLAEYEVDESSWSEPSTPDGSLTSSHHLQSHEFQGQASQHYYQYQAHYSNADAVPANHHNNMDVNLSSDVNQMRYHQG